MNPYEAGSIAVPEEEPVGQSKRVRLVFAFEQVVGAIYVLVLGAFLTGVVRVQWVEVVLGVFLLVAAPVGTTGFVLGGAELSSVRKGRLRLARAVLVNGLGAIFPAWILISTLPQFLFH